MVPLPPLPPFPAIAWLPVNVLFTTVRPASLKMAPPWPTPIAVMAPSTTPPSPPMTWLPVKVLSVTVAVPD